MRFESRSTHSSGGNDREASHSARIVLSRTLRPNRNDVPQGSIAPKDFVEGLDLVLGDDDRASPDPPATDVCQEPGPPDDVRLLPHPLLSLVSVDLSEELSALAGGQTARLVAYEAERLGGELPSRRPDGFLKPGRIHPSTSRQMDSMVSKLFRAFARSARVPEFPETNLARALWSR